MAIPYSDVSPFAMNRIYYTGGESVFDRYQASSVGLGTFSGDLRLTGFTALHTETCNNITSYATATAAAATPTLCKMAVYQVDPTTGNLTLLSATANDITLWNTANSRYIRPITPQFNKVANSFYMLGWLIVSAAATPTLSNSQSQSAAMFSNTQSQIPPSVGRVTGLADLPTTIPPTGAGGYAINTTSPFFMEVLP